jgi:membrane fusion protein, adhesin transport system
MRQPTSLDYANSVDAALDEGAPRFGRTLLALITALVAASIAWAYVAVLDEVTTGQGRVIPTQQMQTAQSLEGGIVRELLAKEGETVEKDQVLIRIDDTSFASRLGELTERQAALKAETVRLEAEASGQTTLVFDPAFRALAPAAVRSETDLFKARAQKLDGELNQLRQQLIQREQERDEVIARQRKIQAELRPLLGELELNQRLANSGNVARVDVLRLQRQVAELQGDARILVSTLPRTDAAINEAKRRIEGAQSNFRTQVAERMSALRSDLAVVDETIKGAQDRVTRTAVRSPVRGTINKLAVTTIGAVVQPGRLMMPFRSRPVYAPRTLLSFGRDSQRPSSFQPTIM